VASRATPVATTAAHASGDIRPEEGATARTSVVAQIQSHDVVLGGLVQHGRQVTVLQALPAQVPARACSVAPQSFLTRTDVT
jgi:hypothetical protein